MTDRYGNFLASKYTSNQFFFQLTFRKGCVVGFTKFSGKSPNLSKIFFNVYAKNCRQIHVSASININLTKILKFHQYICLQYVPYSEYKRKLTYVWQTYYLSASFASNSCSLFFPMTDWLGVSVVCTLLLLWHQVKVFIVIVHTVFTIKPMSNWYDESKIHSPIVTLKLRRHFIHRMILIIFNAPIFFIMYY